MSYTISMPQTIKELAPLENLMTEYYGVVFSKLASVGGATNLSRRGVAVDFVEKIEIYLPPDGRMTLVHDASGTLVGACTLNKVRPDAAELKRLFVRPSANGHGLGRRIMECQFDEARKQGWKTILINVIKKNNDMLRICEKMGFQYIDRYPECADPAELAEYFVYLKYDLADIRTAAT